MKKINGYISLPIITGLLLTLITGIIYADEMNSCASSCTSDLKECRKQAYIATSTEAHPIISGSSESRAYRNGQGAPMIANNVLPNSQNSEIEKRQVERYQLCATENSSCLHQCSPKPTPPKISVIFK